MSDSTFALLDKLEGSTGVVRKARAELGMGALELGVWILPEGTDLDESGDEEIYIVLDGEGTIEIDGEEHKLSRDRVVRTGSGTNRRLRADQHGLRVLAIRGSSD
jgi:mannose-6-phosphate isomerase-like protein (cupin superfamily)